MDLKKVIAVGGGRKTFGNGSSLAHRIYNMPNGLKSPDSVICYIDNYYDTYNRRMKMCQLDRLLQMKAHIYQIAKKHNAEKVYVFGSCARKEETPDSDIDFLADFNNEASLFDQVGLQLELADALHCKVDVIPLSSLTDPEFGPKVEKEMVLL